MDALKISVAEEYKDKVQALREKAEVADFDVFFEPPIYDEICMLVDGDNRPAEDFAKIASALRDELNVPNFALEVYTPDDTLIETRKTFRVHYELEAHYETRY